MTKQHLQLDWATHKAARYACEHWHYSKCIPAGKLVKVGVWEHKRFIGVVLFGRGANNNLAGRYNLRQDQVCELVRIALKAHTTPVTRIVSLAIKFLRRQSKGLQLIVSYADPQQGHHGGIYQAGNWIYAGRSEPQRALLIDGVPTHKRSASIKYGTASPQIIAAMTGKKVEWSAVESKHVYLMALNASTRARVLQLAQPYPKRGKQAMAATSGTAAGQHRPPRSK